MRFRDRRDAGRQLAACIASSERGDVPMTVLALARGGVPVGYELARELGVPLDVIVARRIAAPGRPDLSLGALGEGGAAVVDPALVRALEVAPEALDEAIERTADEVARRAARYRGSRPLPELRGRRCVLATDGLAATETVRAALAAVRARAPERLLLALPACAPDAAAAFRAEFAELRCLAAPGDAGAEAVWYEEFAQTDDDEVVALLAASRT